VIICFEFDFFINRDFDNCTILENTYWLSKSDLSWYECGKIFWSRFYDKFRWCDLEALKIKTASCCFQSVKMVQTDLQTLSNDIFCIGRVKKIWKTYKWVKYAVLVTYCYATGAPLSRSEMIHTHLICLRVRSCHTDSFQREVAMNF